jgi:hypothetical protein
VTPQDVDDFCAVKLSTAGLSAQTVSHLRAILRTALNHALRRGKIPSNR